MGLSSFPGNPKTCLEHSLHLRWRSFSSLTLKLRLHRKCLLVGLIACQNHKLWSWAIKDSKSFHGIRTRTAHHEGKEEGNNKTWVYICFESIPEMLSHSLLSLAGNVGENCATKLTSSVKRSFTVYLRNNVTQIHVRRSLSLSLVSQSQSVTKRVNTNLPAFPSSFNVSLFLDPLVSHIRDKLFWMECV